MVGADQEASRGARQEKSEGASRLTGRKAAEAGRETTGTRQLTG